MRIVDYYAVLGVAPDSEDVVIRAAYKALMLKYHPDQNRDGQAAAEAKAKEINAAYSILSNPAARRAYDERRRTGQEQPRKPHAPREERASSPPPPPAPPFRPTPAAQPPEMPSTSWKVRAAQWLGVILVIAGFKAAFTAANTSSPTSSNSVHDEETWNPLLEAPIQTSQAPPFTIPDPASIDANAPEVIDTSIKPEEIRRAVSEFDRVYRSDGILGAADYSRECFSQLALSRSWAQSDHCLAFDYVAQEVEKASAYSRQLGYFQDGRTSSRHSSALGQLDRSAFLDYRRRNDIKDRAQEEVRRFVQNSEQANSRASTTSVDRGPPPRRTTPGSAIVPLSFHGTYRESLDECGRHTESSLAIGLRTIQFYESIGQVEAATVSQGELVVRGTYRGEGQSWAREDRFTLSADRQQLTAISLDGSRFIRLRCP